MNINIHFTQIFLDNLSLKGNIINVVAAGNGNNLPKEHYVNEITSIGMSYNSIIVGSLNDSKNSYLKPSNFSSYKTNSSYSYENLPKPINFSTWWKLCLSWWKMT
ncbi:hypothetical protein NW066_00615 [Mycoplasmopsis felis]|uniref:hypothetical protein n=1 Tax=Mycoplasmopsis felis TaxID=33923 RepID=UPI0021AF7DA2|nr:hypothetical protein [Mycoplasmopsis felis]UWV85243.1 hypothetical protein NW066_00615 [Mycoplasmopsis felis]